MDERLTLTRLTAPGRSALAVLLVEGPGALRLVSDFFHTKGSNAARGPSRLEPGDRLFVGRFEDSKTSDAGRGARAGEQIVVRCRSESCVEINCHGGEASIERIESILAAHGCRLIDWRQRAFRQSDDPLRAAALAALAEAQTMRTAAVFLDQYQGALRCGIESILTSLADGDLAAAESRIRGLLAWADFGRHLVEPWRVVLAGRPNVGKSTLLNALAGYKRAIVHHTPGTTRDVLTVTTALEGWPVVLADTAGLRSSEEAIERSGVQLAEEELQAADLVLLISDASMPWSDADQQLSRRTGSPLVVHNKIDLCGDSPLEDVLRDRPSGIAISSLRGTGIEQLAGAIAQRLVPQLPAPLAAVPFTARQIATLQTTLAAVGQAAVSLAAPDVARDALWLLIHGGGCESDIG